MRTHLPAVVIVGVFASFVAVSAQSPVQAPLTSSEAGGPRNLEVVATSVNMREQATTASPTILVLKSGAVLDNLGCSEIAQRTWCDVQPLGGGPRGFVAGEFLKPAAALDGTIGRGPDDSSLRAGEGRFDAKASIPCAKDAGQPTGSCAAAVARAGSGYATVEVTHPGGQKRLIWFRMGRAIGTDASRGEFRTSRDADLTTVRVGTERYEIPDAFIFGG